MANIRSVEDYKEFLLARKEDYYRDGFLRLETERKRSKLEPYQIRSRKEYAATYLKMALEKKQSEKNKKPEDNKKTEDEKETKDEKEFPKGALDNLDEYEQITEESTVDKEIDESVNPNYLEKE